MAEIEVNLPAFYCPIPANEYRYGGERKRRSMAWMGQFGFLDDLVMLARVEDTAANMWFSLMIPDADPEYLQLLADWCYLGFYFDDIYCPDSGGQVDAAADFWAHAGWMIRLLEAPSALGSHHEPLYDAIRSLSIRLREFATQTQMRRIITAHREWLWGTGWQLANKSKDRMPGLNSYVTFRMIDSAAPPTFAFLEVSCGEVSDAELDHPVVRAMREASYFCAAVDNDLLSYGKELWFARQSPESQMSACNIVEFLLPQYDGDLDSAVRRAVSMRDRAMHLFIALRAAVWNEVSDPLRKYLIGLGNSTRQNIQWSLFTPRYRNPDGQHPDAVATHGGVHDQPPPEGLEPLPIPTISWWWDLASVRLG